MESRTSAPPVLEELNEGVLSVTLSRPERRNAIDPAMRELLAAAIDRAASDPAVRAVILVGAGGNFCAGGDLGSFDELHDARVYRHVSHRLTATVESLERLEKPVVGALAGVTTGAGLALALACDWRVATASCRLLFREGRIGLVPTHGGLTRLVKLVGLAAAKEALLGGEDIELPAAMRLGLVGESVDDDADLVPVARARAEKMLRRAPLSFAAAKRLLQLAADTDLHGAMLAESLAQTTLLQSSDHAEGLAAAREGRLPDFGGH